jgi:hypothetical protein
MLSEINLDGRTYVVLPDWSQKGDSSRQITNSRGKGPLSEKKNDDNSSLKVHSGPRADFVFSFVSSITDSHHFFLRFCFLFSVK